MSEERRLDGISSPNAGASRESSTIVSHLKSGLKERGFLFVTGMVIPKRVISEILASNQLPLDTEALPSLVGRAMGGTVEDLSLDRQTSGFYIFTKEQQSAS